MKRYLYTMILSAALFMPALSFAADHYVRQGASGANNGNNWADAYSSLPATLTRGDTYYVADGTYSGHTFDDPASGTTVITVKKAIASDHGTSTGWDNSYGDGQALFTGQFTFNTSYYTINGQTGGGPGSWESGYGFKIKRSGTGTVRAIVIETSYITLKHMDIENNGMNQAGNGDTIYGHNWSNLKVSYCWIHNTNRTNFLVSGSWQNGLLEYSLISERHNNDGLHGEHMSLNNTGNPANATIRYNIFRNAGGANTGVIVIKGKLDSGYTAQSGYKIYGNLFYNTSGFDDLSTNGVITDTTGSLTTNVKIYNNTFLPHTIAGGGPGRVVNFSGSSSGNVYKNNVSFGNPNSPIGVSRSYNVWDSSSLASESNGQYVSSQSTLFTNPSNYDYTLNIATNDGDTSIGTEYNTDAYGRTRGSAGVWDRGAYEFGGTAVATKPSPPTNLIVN